jgi:hypothetical protein
MKTRSRGEDDTHGLPPPPAPTAHDANPWEMSASPKASPKFPDLRPPVRKRGARPDLSRVTPGQRRRIRWLPLLILFFVAGTGVQLAIRALWAGDVAAAIGALVVVAFVAFVVLRRFQKRSS